MIAFTFPGQGSQRPGHGCRLARPPRLGARRGGVRRPPGATSPACCSTPTPRSCGPPTTPSSPPTWRRLVVLDAVERLGLEASHLAGHSLGEYTALTAAGVLTFEDGVRLVAERGEAMQDAARAQPGTMAAVLGRDDDAVEAACAEVRAGGLDVWVANYNAPGQVVIAGSPEALEAAGVGRQGPGREADHAGRRSAARSTRPYMAPAHERLDRAIAAAALRRRRRCRSSPTSTAPLHHSGAEWAALASRQLCRPVRWRQALRTLRRRGRDHVRRARPGHGAHRHGQAHRDRRHDRLGRRRPTSSTLLEVVAGRRRPRATRASTSRHRAARRQPAPGSVR